MALRRTPGGTLTPRPCLRCGASGRRGEVKVALGDRGPGGSEKRRHLEVFGWRSGGASKCCRANAFQTQMQWSWTQHTNEIFATHYVRKMNNFTRHTLHRAQFDRFRECERVSHLTFRLPCWVTFRCIQHGLLLLDLGDGETWFEETTTFNICHGLFCILKKFNTSDGDSLH